MRGQRLGWLGLPDARGVLQTWRVGTVIITTCWAAQALDRFELLDLPSSYVPPRLSYVANVDQRVGGVYSSACTEQASLAFWPRETAAMRSTT